MVHLGDTLTTRKAEGEGSLLAYLMAGSVGEERLLEVVEGFAAQGVTGIELGFPFSDPMAEGPIIQRAAMDALTLGTHWDDLFRLLRQVSRTLPCAVMTYLNPVLQQGIDRSLTRIAQAGGSALILPDLPMEEIRPFRSGRKRTHVDTVLLASPATGADRVRALARTTEGFLYMVSRYGVTGTPTSSGAATGRDSLPVLFQLVHTTRPSLPVLAGFGVSTPRDVQRLSHAGADGVIVGSAFQRMLSEGENPRQISQLAASLVGAL